MHVCLHVCITICACDKVINIKICTQKRDNVTCNMKVETETDVRSDVNQAVK